MHTIKLGKVIKRSRKKESKALESQESICLFLLFFFLVHKLNRYKMFSTFIIIII